jgi:hypothetical protein
MMLDGRGGSVANVEVLPVPMLSVSNWGLRLGIGNTGSIITQGWVQRDIYGAPSKAQ